MKLSHHPFRDLKSVCMWHKGHGWPWLGERLDLMIFEASSNWAILRCDAVRMLKTDGYLKEKIILGKTFGVAIPPICRNRCHASFSSQILISRSLVPVVQVVVTFSLLFCCSQTQLLFPYSTSSNYLNFPINIDSSSCISSWILILGFFCGECLPNAHLAYCTSGKVLVSLGACSHGDIPCLRFWVQRVLCLSALTGKFLFF